MIKHRPNATQANWSRTCQRWRKGKGEHYIVAKNKIGHIGLRTAQSFQLQAKAMSQIHMRIDTEQCAAIASRRMDGDWLWIQPLGAISAPHSLENFENIACSPTSPSPGRERGWLRKTSLTSGTIITWKNTKKTLEGSWNSPSLMSNRTWPKFNSSVTREY